MNKYQEALDDLSYPDINSPCYGAKCGETDCGDCNIKRDILTLKELVDKATPLKPQKECVQYVVDGTYYSCPCCGYLIDKFCIMQDNNYKKIVITTSRYCSNCGQALDWSDEDVD